MSSFLAACGRAYAHENYWAKISHQTLIATHAAQGIAMLGWAGSENRLTEGRIVAGVALLVSAAINVPLTVYLTKNVDECSCCMRAKVPDFERFEKDVTRWFDYAVCFLLMCAATTAYSSYAAVYLLTLPLFVPIMRHKSLLRTVCFLTGVGAPWTTLAVNAYAGPNDLWYFDFAAAACASAFFVSVALYGASESKRVFPKTQVVPVPNFDGSSFSWCERCDGTEANDEDDSFISKSAERSKRSPMRASLAGFVMIEIVKCAAFWLIFFARD